MKLHRQIIIAVSGMLAVMIIGTIGFKYLQHNIFRCAVDDDCGAAGADSRGAKELLLPGDMVIIFGTRDQLQVFEQAAKG